MNRKILGILTILMIASASCVSTSIHKQSRMIKVGIINSPPIYSRYTKAQVEDFEKIFTEENGYMPSTYYSIKVEEQLDAASRFIKEGADYILLNAANPNGWELVLKSAKEADIKVLLFDRMVNVDPKLYEAAIIPDFANEGGMAVAWLKAQDLSEYRIIHLQGAMGTKAQIGRTAALDAEFAAGNMKKVIQQTATWDDSTAKNIVESIIKSGKDFNVIYAENDGMARGAVEALDEAGITHGIDGKVIIISFNCAKWALREILNGNWNYNGQSSPFQASKVDEMIKKLEAGEPIEFINARKQVYFKEKSFDAKTITQADIDNYGI